MSQEGAFQSSMHAHITSFFQDIKRIAASDYVPTECDILRSHNGIRGISKHRFHVDWLTINIINAGLQRGERRKWIRQFDDVAAVLFVVDLPCYDQEASDENEMEDRIELFDGVINTKWILPTTRFILFLSNITAFQQKLSHTPFKDYFPDCEGGSEAEVIDYLLRRSREVNREGRKIYEYCVDPNKAENIELVAAAIND